MFPTLAPGDRLLVLHPAFRIRPGDLVLARDGTAPGRDLVKRVAAITGPPHQRHYILLGDNLDSSTDSRHFGPVDPDAITGRVLLRYWPDSRRGRPR